MRRRDAEKARAERFYEQALPLGVERPVTEVEAERDAAEISERTARRAQKSTGYRSRKLAGRHGHWVCWREVGPRAARPIGLVSEVGGGRRRVTMIRAGESFEEVVERHRWAMGVLRWRAGFLRRAAR